MKKILTIIMIFSICATYASAAQAVKFSKKFIKNFKDCDAYSETTTSEFEGQTFTTTRKIIGWGNGMCKYQTIISSKTDKYLLDCSFSDIQLDEIYNAMKKHPNKIERASIDLFSPQKDPKTGEIKYNKAGNTIIKGNKGYIVWSKYENNPYFCKPSKL